MPEGDIASTCVESIYFVYGQSNNYSYYNLPHECYRVFANLVNIHRVILNRNNFPFPAPNKKGNNLEP